MPSQVTHGHRRVNQSCRKALQCGERDCRIIIISSIFRHPPKGATDEKGVRQAVIGCRGTGFIACQATCAKLTGMSCPSCGQRKGRRECPALGATICAICCGTKRLVEIRCPPTCSYLAAAREHPAAVVKRQREQDVALLLPTIRHLTERQHQLFFLLHSVVARHKPDAAEPSSRRGCRPGCRGGRVHAGDGRPWGAVRAHSGVAPCAETCPRDYGDDRRDSGTRNEDLRWRAGDHVARHRTGRKGHSQTGGRGHRIYLARWPAPSGRRPTNWRRDAQACKFPDSALTLLQYEVCAPGRCDAGRNVSEKNSPDVLLVPVP